MFTIRFNGGDKTFKTLKEAKDYAVRNYPVTEGKVIMSPTPGVGYEVVLTNSLNIDFKRVDVLCPWEEDD